MQTTIKIRRPARSLQSAISDITLSVRGRTNVTCIYLWFDKIRLRAVSQWCVFFYVRIRTECSEHVNSFIDAYWAYVRKRTPVFHYSRFFSREATCYSVSKLNRFLISSNRELIRQRKKSFRAKKSRLVENRLYSDLAHTQGILPPQWKGRRKLMCPDQTFGRSHDQNFRVFWHVNFCGLCQRLCLCLLCWNIQRSADLLMYKLVLITKST